MDSTKWQARTIPDLIIEVWEALDCESVGRHELESIQHALLEKFGRGANESPAAIARTVADEGAVLRHPEVFECDSAWREQNLGERELTANLDFSNLAQALSSLGRIEEKRHELGDNSNQLDRLREIVINARHESLLSAKSKILGAEHREEAREVSEWLAVWLRSPQLFPDWLDLRMRAAEFREKFPQG